MQDRTLVLRLRLANAVARILGVDPARPGTTRLANALADPALCPAAHPTLHVVPPAALEPEPPVPAVPAAPAVPEYHRPHADHRRRVSSSRS